MWDTDIWDPVGTKFAVRHHHEEASVGLRCVCCSSHWGCLVLFGVTHCQLENQSSGLANINSNYICFWIVCFIKNSALFISLWRLWTKNCYRDNKLICYRMTNKPGKQVIKPKEVSTFARGNWSLDVFFTHSDKLMICGMKRRHAEHSCTVM